MQKAIGVAVDGIPGPKTIGATPEVSANKNSRHAVVKPLQKWLNHKGYKAGTPDGIAGPKFTEAVKAFKRKELGATDPKGVLAAKGDGWRKLLGMSVK